MSLKEYRKKRSFDATPEPPGREEPAPKRNTPLIFVVQKHQASHLHYDFRLEWNGALLSWAVPKGLSLDPSVKRLAMPTEDHPIEYAGFEGVIPPGQYGAGTVMAWDQGVWAPEVEDVDAALRGGELKFELRGTKLKGSWVLVRTGGSWAGSGRPAWLLIKHRDRFASKKDITLEEPRSASTRRLLVEIAQDEGGDVERAAAGDPNSKGARPGATASSGRTRARRTRSAHA